MRISLKSAKVIVVRAGNDMSKNIIKNLKRKWSFFCLFTNFSKFL